MPWSNQSGGGGPRKPGNLGPWGQGNGGGPPTPPNFEDWLRRGQDKLRQVMPGGSLTSRGIMALVLIGALVWLLSGFYTVQTNEVGLNFIFGRYTGKTSAGLNYNFPAPIGAYQKLAVTDRMSIDIGSTFEQDDARRGSFELAPDVPEESLMLTGDENIADVKFRVNWQIDPIHPEDYAFSLRNPAETVKAVAESAMREIVGRTDIQVLLTNGREKIEPAAQAAMQKILDTYKAGVTIVEVQLLSVDPPQSVIPAFRDVTTAQQDLVTQSNQAQTYANTAVPTARGGAARIIQEAEAYREQIVAEARGQASRYNQIYATYKQAPAITRQRMYLETMEQVLTGSNKIILDGKAAAPVPYLPLGDMMRQRPEAEGASK